MNYLSPLEMLYKWELEKPNDVYLSQPIDGVLHNWTWKEFGKEVRKMASYITSLQLPDNSKIGLLSKNFCIVESSPSGCKSSILVFGNSTKTKAHRPFWQVSHGSLVLAPHPQVCQSHISSVDPRRFYCTIQPRIHPSECQPTTPRT